MPKFKVGQRVKLTEKGRSHYTPGMWNEIFIISAVLKTPVSLPPAYKLNIVKYPAVKPTYVLEDGICLAAPTCPVCEQEIETDNNKIKEHKYKHQLCYGSYTPIL